MQPTPLHQKLLGGMDLSPWWGSGHSAVGAAAPVSLAPLIPKGWNTFNNLELRLCIVEIWQKQILSLNRNRAVNAAAVNAGQVTMTTRPTGYVMFSDPFFKYMLRKGAGHTHYSLIWANGIR